MSSRPATATPAAPATAELTSPVVFVHGYPDTHRVWDPLRAELQGYRTVALDLPGFGTPRRGVGQGTRWDLARWLTRQLQEMDGPVHLVAHDVGGMLAHRVLLEDPGLLRSWTITSTCDPEWGWHQDARIWQTTRLGEQARDEYLAYPREYLSLIHI